MRSYVIRQCTIHLLNIYFDRKKNQVPNFGDRNAKKGGQSRGELS